jgi:hypothetical protein
MQLTARMDTIFFRGGRARPSKQEHRCAADEENRRYHSRSHRFPEHGDEKYTMANPENRGRGCGANGTPVYQESAT